MSRADTIIMGFSPRPLLLHSILLISKKNKSDFAFYSIRLAFAW